MNTNQDLSKMEQDLLEQAFRTIRSLKTPIVLEALLREHRTNQQSFWRQINALIREYAKLDDTHFDARNEGAHRYVQDICQCINDDHIVDCLPLI